MSLTDLDLAAIHDVEFHRAIGRATHNDLYVVLLDAVGGSLLEVRRANLGREGAVRQTIDLHRAILDAILRADELAAAEAMRQHLQNVDHLWYRQSVPEATAASEGLPEHD
jgi:GntR family transcriptional repressor for pyruvate dehydrogenase complex